MVGDRLASTRSRASPTSADRASSASSRSDGHLHLRHQLIGPIAHAPPLRLGDLLDLAGHQCRHRLARVPRLPCRVLFEEEPLESGGIAPRGGDLALQVRGPLRGGPRRRRPADPPGRPVARSPAPTPRPPAASRHRPSARSPGPAARRPLLTVSRTDSAHSPAFIGRPIRGLSPCPGRSSAITRQPASAKAGPTRHHVPEDPVMPWRSSATWCTARPSRLPLAVSEPHALRL